MSDSLLKLNSNPDLRAIQEYVNQLEIERGFTGNSIQQECLLLGEEVGELFKAVRKQQKMLIDSKSKVAEVEEELADILIYICAIANRLNVNLEQALRDKEEINKKRNWHMTA